MANPTKSELAREITKLGGSPDPNASKDDLATQLAELKSQSGNEAPSEPQEPEAPAAPPPTPQAPPQPQDDRNKPDVQVALESEVRSLRTLASENAKQRDRARGDLAVARQANQQLTERVEQLTKDLSEKSREVTRLNGTLQSSAVSDIPGLPAETLHLKEGCTIIAAETEARVQAQRGDVLFATELTGRKLADAVAELQGVVGQRGRVIATSSDQVKEWREKGYGVQR